MKNLYIFLFLLFTGASASQRNNLTKLDDYLDQLIRHPERAIKALPIDVLRALDQEFGETFEDDLKIMLQQRYAEHLEQIAEAIEEEIEKDEQCCIDCISSLFKKKDPHPKKTSAKIKPHNH